MDSQDRPPIRVQETTHGGRQLFDFVIATGLDPGPDVTAEFVEIAVHHELPPEGGCYDVAARDLQDGPTQFFLGGMYVTPAKRDAVWSDLQSRGYRLTAE